MDGDAGVGPCLEQALLGMGPRGFWMQVGQMRPSSVLGQHA